MGTDYGNAHISYKYAKLVNNHNREETDKNLLRVKLDGINHNISRGARLAVDIYGDRLKKSSDDSVKDELTVQDSQQDRETVVFTHLTLPTLLLVLFQVVLLVF